MKYGFLIPAMLLVLASCQRGASPLESVDPNIGGVGVLLQPTRPTVHLPNQLIRWSPTRADLLDDMVEDYPLTLTSHRLHSVFGFLPLAGNELPSGWQDARQEYDREKTTPYAYEARLEGCSIQFAPAQRSGIIKLRFDDGEGGFLRFRTRNGEGGSFSLEDNVLSGHEAFAGLDAYTVVVFDAPVSIADAADQAILLKAGKQEITARYAISYIDAGQAAATLEREIPSDDMAAVRGAAQRTWESTLGLIDVCGGTDSERRLFYTSLYRCWERMVDISEYGRYFSSFDHEVHSTDASFYTDNWLWDTHIALEPLHMILDPEREEQKLASYIEMYRQSGAVPSFATIFGDWPAMTGNYAAVWYADALCKGLSFDVEDAYEGVRHNALEETLLPWRNGPRCALDRFYDEHGWYPALHPGEAETESEVSLPWERRQAVSLSTAFSYCDWAAGKLAEHLGKTEDAQLFAERALYYKNVYRPDKGMLWPRDKEGQWIEGVDPRYMDRAYYTENNAYTFQWDVKHDLDGLFTLMGGRAEAEKKLDELFRIHLDIPKFRFYGILPDATGMVGQFAMGNEPSFHIPYLYDYLGSPWKTQKRVRQLVDMLFSDTVSGIPGDEDGGGMSAFVVFSMMGFFPVTPGVPVYAIGTPFFEKVSVSLPGGKRFTIKAKGASRDKKYIVGATLDSRKLDRAWFTHDELMSGGTLVLEMSEVPDKSWGADNLPPVISK